MYVFGRMPPVTAEERARWDRRYAEGEYTPRPDPSPFLVEWAARVPIGRALDLATGTGRNALHLAEVGFDVRAIDGSAVAIDLGRREASRRGLRVDWQVADLDEVRFERGVWDLITVFRYRNVDLWPKLVEALAPDGWIVAEHHLATDRDVHGPASSEFRVQPGEFLDAFGDLRVVAYREGVEPSEDPTREFCLARIVACNGNPGF